METHAEPWTFIAAAVGLAAGLAVWLFRDFWGLEVNVVCEA